MGMSMVWVGVWGYGYEVHFLSPCKLKLATAADAFNEHIDYISLSRGVVNLKSFACIFLIESTHKRSINACLTQNAQCNHTQKKYQCMSHTLTKEVSMQVSHIVQAESHCVDCNVICHGRQRGEKEGTGVNFQKYM